MSGLGQPILEARDVHRTYRVAGRSLHALRGVSLSLPRGETLALVGESGSGKSTLARLLVCLERPDAGEVLLDGSPVSRLAGRKLAPLRRRVQMVFQDPTASLDPRLRVGAIVAEPLAVHRIWPRRERRQRVAELLARVGLDPQVIDRYPHELSGGQRQRVSLARALAVDPEVIIADEPVSALDVSVRAQVLNLMLDLQEALGLSYLLVAHDLALVGQVARQVAVMYLGVIVEQGPADELFSRPLHPYTAALLAAVPRPDPLLRRGGPPPLRGETPSPFALPPGCPFQTRCMRAIELCRQDAPELRPWPGGRLVACHRAGEGDTVDPPIDRFPSPSVREERGKRAGDLPPQ